MPEQPPDPVATLEVLRGRLGGVRPQTRCYLAVLVLASQWPGRFRDGWVSRSDVSRYGGNAGGTEVETSQRAASRAWEQLDHLAPVVRLEQADLPGHRRRRRLIEPSTALVDWLFVDGVQELLPETWRDFLAEESRESGDQAVLRGLDEVAAEILLAQGRNSEADLLIAERLSSALTKRARAAMDHLRARLLIRRGRMGDWQAAHDALERLAEAVPSGATLLDRLQNARIRIDLAYARFLTQMMGLKDSTTLETEAGLVRGWLARAVTFEPILSYADLARLRNVEALVAKCFLRTSDGAERENCFRQADQKLLEAFALYRLTGDAIGLGNVTYNLGELRYVYHRLDERGATATAVHDALRWYEVALAFNTKLATNQDRFYDYARIADCLGLLLAIERETAAQVVQQARLARAQEYLAIVEEQGAAIERRLANWTAARLRANAYLAGLLEAPEGKDPSSMLSGLEQPSQSLRKYAAERQPLGASDAEPGQ